MSDDTKKREFITERGIYSEICRNEGIKARQIGLNLGIDRSEVNHFLYASPYMRELCYRDQDFLWHGLIHQMRPHIGLGDFSGHYGTVGEFLEQDEDAWLQELCRGCERIGRNLNDTRGLFHSFRDCRRTMRQLFADLQEMGFPCERDWELAFELRINRERYIRIYADVLLITAGKVYSLEFKMKDRLETMLPISRKRLKYGAESGIK